MTLTHGELFAGIGGFGLGFDRAGMKTIWHVEIDPHCQEILRRHNPDSLILSDVCECGKDNLLRVDVISFGSPCQDLSVAGKRKGFQDGTRSNLFFEAIRIVDELKPAFAVWENVPGALSSHSGRDFAAVLSAFRECGARDIAWRILDAQYFGVAQRRRRVFIVADFGGERAAEILFESESGARHTPPRRETGQRTSTGTGKNSENHGGSREIENIGEMKQVPYNVLGLSGNAKKRHAYATETARTLDGWSGVEDKNAGSTLVLQRTDGALQTRDAKGIGTTIDDKIILAFNGRGDGSDAQENITPTMRSLPNKDGHQTGSAGLVVAIPIHDKATRYKGGGNTRNDDGAGNGSNIGEEGDPMYTLGTSDKHMVAFQQNTRNEVRLMGGEGQFAGALSAQSGMKQQNYIAWEMQHASEAYRESGEIAPTLQQRMGTGGNQVPMVGVRRLTPIECARLQGFPDDWCSGQADTTQYRQYGNAVAVPVVEWIGKRIVKAEVQE